MPSIELNQARNSEVRLKFANRIRIDKSGCWIWTAYCNQNGYGRFHIDGEQFQAHRISYLLAVGKIPKGKLVCHHCDNPPCVNPSHLFIGSQKDNAQDAIKKGRWRAGWQNKIKTHCSRGHKLISRNLLSHPAKFGWRSCRKCAVIYTRNYKQRIAKNG